MVTIIDDKQVIGALKRIMKKNVSHEDKILLLESLRNNKTPNVQYLIDGFINSERLLVRKKGLDAAEVLQQFMQFLPELVWLYEYQAFLYSRYAYHDISSGAIQKAHDIYTQHLGWRPEDSWFRIATVLKKYKGYGFAAQAYENAGKPELAARMLKAQKKFQQAAWYFEKAGFWKDAAILYRRERYDDKAGECFARHGDLRSAVKCWKKAGTLEQHNIGKDTYRNIMSKGKSI